jgi:predicted nucleotidyltransferase component of viral defense system
MNLFDKLVDEALKNQPTLLNLRIVVEKELLHHDILRILSEHGLLKGLTFIGGTALRSCYSGNRLSEDLDFTGGINFTRSSLSDMGQILTKSIYNKYGLHVTVSEPQKDSSNVDTWKLRIITRAEQRNLPAQRINIDICALPSYKSRPMMLINPYKVDMGTNGLIIQVQSLEEIYTDKIIAFALRSNRIKHRDLWDILWLRQKGIVPKIELIPHKLKDRKCNINEFLKLLTERVKLLEDKRLREEFLKEMERFLPLEQIRIASQTDMWVLIGNFMSDISLQVRYMLSNAENIEVP